MGGCHCLRWCMLLIEGENGVNYWSWDRRAVLVGVYCVEVVNLGFRLLAEYFESNIKISLFSTPTECISFYFNNQQMHAGEPTAMTILPLFGEFHFGTLLSPTPHNCTPNAF